jgi:ABC-2 type transport system permease protein
MLLVPTAVAVAMTLTLNAGTSLDPGRMATATLGLLLTVVLISAAGIWVSGTSRHPPVAAGLLYGVFLMLWLAQSTSRPAAEEINLVQWLALPTHLEPLMEGHLRAADLAMARATLGRLRGEGA